MKKQFEINTFVKTSKIIEVKCEKDGFFIPVTIPLTSFVHWLYENDKSQFSFYWESSHCIEDLYEYITTHPIIFRDKVIENALESIVNEFKILSND